MVMKLFNALASARLAFAAVDTGFELLYQNSDKDVPRTCWPSKTLPPWLNGSFILPSVGTFYFGGKAFQGVLDGFGKLHRFELNGKDGEVCETAKMMRTGFYNDSIALGDVAPTLLFMETDPPRHCDVPLCNLIEGKNDNTYVTVNQLGDHYTSWTDSTVADELDPYSLDILGLWEWTDKVGHFEHKGVLSSAHPVRKGADGPWVAIQIDVSLFPENKVSYLDIVLIHDDDPHNRVLVHSKKIADYTPYFHSYGVSENYVTMAYTPLAYNMSATIAGLPMIDAFYQTSPLITTFEAVPFDGGEPLTFEPDKPFTYNHVVNSYENGTGIVWDAVTFRDAACYLTSAGAILSIQRNKTARDNLLRNQQIWRYHMHLSGEKKGQTTSEPISKFDRMTEFPKINPEYATKPYCIYYALEQFHNNVDNGAVAVYKHDICTGVFTYWYRANWFPSEVYFVPSPEKKAEDDGVVVFTAFDGINEKSHLMLLNATDMSQTGPSLLEQELPERVTFSVHGHFFPGMLGPHPSR